MKFELECLLNQLGFLAVSTSTDHNQDFIAATFDIMVRCLLVDLSYTTEVNLMPHRIDLAFCP